MKSLVVAESKFRWQTKKKLSISSGGFNKYKRIKNLKDLILDSIEFWKFDSLYDMNQAWLSSRITLESRVRAENSSINALPSNLILEQARKETRTMFLSIEKEKEIFVLGESKKIVKGEFENSKVVFNRDGETYISTRYCHRNRFFQTKKDDIVFDSEEELYSHLIGGLEFPSCLREYEYISEIVDLLNKKFYIHYDKDSNMYVPRKILLVTSVALDPNDDVSDYMASILTEENQIVEVKESLLFSTDKEAIKQAIAINKSS